MVFSCRDSCQGNIMMDSRRLIPKGFHFSAQWSHDPPFYYDRFTHSTRMAVAPVDYFFVDYGLSTRFSNYDQRSLVTGIAGQNKTVPELSDEVPYDPFKVDIYQLGGVFSELIEVCSSIATIYLYLTDVHRPIMVLIYSNLSRLPWCTRSRHNEQTLLRL